MKIVLAFAAAVALVITAVAPAVAQSQETQALGAAVSVQELGDSHGMGFEGLGLSLSQVLNPSPSHEGGVATPIAPFIPGGPIVTNALNTASTVLKSRHEVAMNAIRNIR